MLQTITLVLIVAVILFVCHKNKRRGKTTKHSPLTAYRAGNKAFKNKQSFTACPYNNTQDIVAWKQGWSDAYDQHHEVCGKIKHD